MILVLKLKSIATLHLARKLAANFCHETDALSGVPNSDIGKRRHLNEIISVTDCGCIKTQLAQTLQDFRSEDFSSTAILVLNLID